MAEAKEEPVDIRNEKRLRLRPWLLSRLKSGSVPGLEWIDKKEGIFKIPWNHGGKHDWTPEKGHIFKDWAVHTGKFVDGVDEPNHAKWKTNLRCALHKAKDIEEQKNAGRANDDKNPFRVYKFKKIKKKGGVPIPEVFDEPKETFSNSGPPVPTFIATYASSASSGSSHPFSSGHSHPMSVGSEPKSNASSDSGKVNPHQQYDGSMVSPYSDVSSNLSQAVSPSSSENNDDNKAAEELDYDLLKDEILKGLENIECGNLPSDLYDLSLEELQLSGMSDKTSFNEQQQKLNNTTSRNPLQQLTNANQQAIPQKAMPLDTNASYNVQSNAQPFTNDNIQNLNNMGLVTSMSSSQTVVTCSDYTVGLAGNTLFSTAGDYLLNATTTFTDSQTFQTNTGIFPVGNITATDLNQPFIEVSNVSPPVPSPNQEVTIHQSPGSQMSAGSQSDTEMTSIPESPLSATKPSATKPNYSKYSCLGLQYHKCDARYGYEMFVELIYKNNVVKQLHVDQSKGCRLLYRLLPGEKEDVIPDQFKDALYGTEASERQVLEMPTWPSDLGNETAIKKATGVLINAHRGIVLECQNGNIIVTRYCKTKIYSNSKICPEVKRLDPARRLLLFDYEKDFLTSFEWYKTNRQNQNRPSPNVCLFFGQQNVSEQQADKVLVMVRVTSCKAIEVLQRDSEEFEKSSSIHISNPNAYDDLAEQITDHLKISDK